MWRIQSKLRAFALALELPKNTCGTLDCQASQQTLTNCSFVTNSLQMREVKIGPKHSTKQ